MSIFDIVIGGFIALFLFVIVLGWAVGTATDKATDKYSPMCEHNCTVLGKEYYTYKVGSIFVGQSECWCRQGNDTVRIR